MAQMVERPACGLNNRRTGIDSQQGHEIIFVTPKRPEQLWCPQSLLFKGSRGKGEVVPSGGGGEKTTT